MTQIFNEAGERIPVTVVEVGPVTVVQMKTMEKDGYESVQVGFEPITKEKLINKPQRGRQLRQWVRLSVRFLSKYSGIRGLRFGSF